MDHPQLPTGTVTFLFTDIEGSAQLWAENLRSSNRAGRIELRPFDNVTSNTVARVVIMISRKAVWK
jgi:hypothetical protein